MTNSDINELVSAVQSMRGYALKWCKTAEDAEDLMQDTYIRAHLAYDKYDPTRPNSTLKGWVYTIMYNQFVNDLRVKGKFLWSELTEYSSPNYAINDGPSVVAKQELDKEIARIDKPRIRKIVRLRSKGFSFDEIGALMETSGNIVKSLLHNYKPKLHKRFSRYLDDYPNLF